jgi:hypothetical protein
MRHWVVTLDAYLDWRKLAPAEFGRSLRSLRDPNTVRRYLRRLRNGRANRRYRRPGWKVMLDVYRVTGKAVSPNDWI